MTPLTLRPRNAPELFDATFQLWRENFALLFTVVAGAFLPIIGFELISFVIPIVERQVLSRIITTAFESLAWAAVIIIVSERYMGRSITAAQALRAVSDRGWTIFWTNVFFWVMFYVGLVLLIAPGLYLFAKYFAMMPVAVVEQQGVGAAARRAAALSQGSHWRVLGIVGVPWLLYLYSMGAFRSVAYGYTGGVTTFVLTRFLIASIYPLLGIVSTLLYYDLRIRNEGLDLDLIIAEQTTQSASP